MDTIATGDFWRPVDACQRAGLRRSGTVRLVSHGHCLQGQLNAESEIGIAAGIFESDAFAVSAARIGVLELPGSVSRLGEFSGTWMSER